MKTQAEITKQYREYTDKYFSRTKQILEYAEINPIVRYQVFARKPGVVRGVNEAVDFVKSVAGNKVRVYALRNGESYESCEPLMKLEGRIQDLVELETVYLGITSAGLTDHKIDSTKVRKNARDIVEASQGKPVFYFGARHFHWSLDQEIAKICQEQGFAGTSTDIGAKAWNQKGIGTIPHALVISYAAWLKEQGLNLNPTVEAAKAFDKYIDPNVPRIVLIDTFNREITDSIATAEAVPNLKGVRIDTCGENYSQGSREIVLPNLNVPKKYLRNKGVTIPAVWALKTGLNKAGFENLEITVSSGFNAEKTKAFVEADKVYQKLYGNFLFNNIGTGSIENPVMATSDIVAYFSENKNKWVELHKVGRPEIQSNRLREIK